MKAWSSLKRKLYKIFAFVYVFIVGLFCLSIVLDYIFRLAYLTYAKDYDAGTLRYGTLLYEQSPFQLFIVAILSLILLILLIKPKKFLLFAFDLCLLLAIPEEIFYAIYITYRTDYGAAALPYGSWKLCEQNGIPYIVDILLSLVYFSVWAKMKKILLFILGWILLLVFCECIFHTEYEEYKTEFGGDAYPYHLWKKYEEDCFPYIVEVLLSASYSIVWIWHLLLARYRRAITIFQALLDMCPSGKDKERFLQQHGFTDCWFTDYPYDNVLSQYFRKHYPHCKRYKRYRVFLGYVLLMVLSFLVAFRLHSIRDVFRIHGLWSPFAFSFFFVAALPMLGLILFSLIYLVFYCLLESVLLMKKIDNIQSISYELSEEIREYRWQKFK